jgi:hypothetical protein
VQRVTAEPSPQPVFDLTVGQTPEFYANGVLVHNSLDAIRYAIVTHMKQAGAFVGVIAHDIRPD